MAHAELTETMTGEVAQPSRRRSVLASIVHFLGMLVEIPAVVLVGRTGVDPVPVAGDAGRRGGVPPRRAHADDGGSRERQAGDARLSRSDRDLRGAGVSR